MERLTPTELYQFIYNFADARNMSGDDLNDLLLCADAAFETGLEDLSLGELVFLYS
jgi:hypothetical protein